MSLQRSRTRPKTPFVLTGEERTVLEWWSRRGRSARSPANRSKNRARMEGLDCDAIVGAMGESGGIRWDFNGQVVCHRGCPALCITQVDLELSSRSFIGIAKPGFTDEVDAWAF